MDEARGKHLSSHPEMVIGLLSESWGLNAPCNFIPVRVLLLPLYINKSKFLLLSLKYVPLKRISQQCNFTTRQHEATVTEVVVTNHSIFRKYSLVTYFMPEHVQGTETRAEAGAEIAPNLMESEA